MTSIALKAGELDRRIVIERDTPTRDDHGNDVSNWATIATCWARVTYGTGQERRQAAQDNASLPATFLIRRTQVTGAVTPADRIRFEGGIWNIGGAERQDRDAMSITATRRAAAGGA